MNTFAITIWEIAGISGLVSTIFSGLVGFLFYQRQRRVDFRNDYNKMLLAKRINAYQKIESLLSQLSISISSDDGRRLLKVYKYEREVFLKKFPIILNEAFDIWKEAGWIGSDLLEGIKKIYNCMITDYKAIEKDTSLRPVMIGVSNFTEMNILVRKAHVLAVEEILNMDDIKSYLNKKKTDYLIRLQKAEKLVIKPADNS